MKKKCSRCLRKKDLSLFYSCTGSKDGRQSYCKRCSSEAVSVKGDDGLGQTQRYARRLRLEVLSHYGGSPPRCACCKQAQYEFLSIDHENGGGAKQRRELAGKVFSWIKRNRFPSGFRVLCHNCNQSLGAYGYCPHESSDECEYVSAAQDRSTTLRGRILSEALKLVSGGVYPSVDLIKQIVGVATSAVVKHRRALVVAALWPCRVMPGSRAKTEAAMAKTEIAAKALLAAGVYPSVSALSERTGLFESVVSKQRQNLVRVGRWPTEIVGVGKRAPVLSPTPEVKNHAL